MLRRTKRSKNEVVAPEEEEEGEGREEEEEKKKKKKKKKNFQLFSTRVFISINPTSDSISLIPIYMSLTL